MDESLLWNLEKIKYIFVTGKGFGDNSNNNTSYNNQVGLLTSHIIYLFLTITIMFPDPGEHPPKKTSPTVPIQI